MPPDPDADPDPAGPAAPSPARPAALAISASVGADSPLPDPAPAHRPRRAGARRGGRAPGRGGGCGGRCRGPRRIIRFELVGHPLPPRVGRRLEASNSFQAPTDASGSSIDLGQVATAASPAVVNIATTLSNGEQAAGSGLVLTPKGRILTNNHVISGATDIEVEIGVTGDTYSAEVVGYDTADDVAVIQLDDASGLQTIKTAPAASVEEQDLVIAIGNALGRFGTPSVVSGTVTALHQDITAGDGLDQESLQDMIRVEASIQPGDSGGALLDDEGRVIGMNTAADVGGSQFGFSSGTTGFAIPIDRALTIADEILSGDSSNGAHIGKRALLGVVLTDERPGRRRRRRRRERRLPGRGRRDRLRRHDHRGRRPLGPVGRRPADGPRPVPPRRRGVGQLDRRRRRRPSGDGQPRRGSARLATLRVYFRPVRG